MTSTDTDHSDTDNQPKRRPGPFGPAKILLPEGQQVMTIDETETAASALERMVETGYSQLPVLDAVGEVVGVFSYESFGKRMGEIHKLNLPLSQLAVRDMDLGKAFFIDPEHYIDTETDWSEIDHVLIGNKSELLGVLTIADVFGRLNDFAEAFVLLYEIEHEIRDLILEVYPGGELNAVFEKLSTKSDSPERTAAMGLEELVEGHDAPITDKKMVKAIRYGVNLLQRASQSRPITDLKDFTFAQYRELIFSKDNWERFEQIFAKPREILNLDFDRVNDLRNIVFHFRRGILPGDTDRLRRFRDELRYNRELYEKSRQKAAAAAGSS